PAGLGNAHDLVGRCFMEHLHLDCGILELREARAAALYDPHPTRSTCVKAVLALSEDTLRREGLLNYSALLDTRVPAPIRRVLHWLPERVAWRLRTQRARRLRTCRIADSNASRAMRAGSATRPVHTRMEQAPNLESRVTLGDERDALGRRRARLDWRLTPLDKRSMRRSLAILGEEVTRAGVGRWRAGLDADDASWREA